MITQNFIYKAAQRAFEENHPKFPWPKKHELEDQTDGFKRAILMLSADINAEHERHLLGVKANRDSYRDSAIEANNRTLEARKIADSHRVSRNIAWLMAFVLFVIMLGFATGSIAITKKCVDDSENYSFRFTDSVVTYDKYGQRELKPVCK